MKRTVGYGATTCSYTDWLGSIVERDAGRLERVARFDRAVCEALQRADVTAPA